MMTNIYKTNYGMDVSVELIRDDSSVKVKVLAPVYMRKEWMMDHSYSLQFTDAQIMGDRDFNRVMCKAYPKDY